MSHGAVVAMVTGVKLALSASRGQEVLMTRSVRAQPLVCVSSVVLLVPAYQRVEMFCAEM